MELDNNNHSVFMLQYRLILPTNKLIEVMDNQISERLRAIFENIAVNYNMTLLSWDSYNNYLDLTFKAHPNTELSKFINAYKSAGSRLIKKELPEVEHKIHNGQFWHKSFCLLTKGVESQTTDEIAAYLKKLKE